MKFFGETGAKYSGCHPPCGGCGLKSLVCGRYVKNGSHPPCGGCGLKLSTLRRSSPVPRSPSMRRVWIEIVFQATYIATAPRHPPCGGCGLKLDVSIVVYISFPGHPPCGGCGLKYLLLFQRLYLNRHPPCGGCGLKSFLYFIIGTAREGHPPCGGCGLKLRNPSF